jgi:two-component system LytT family response regulator
MAEPTGQAPLRAVVVDDEALGRDCVRIALERRGDVAVVAECDEGPAAVAAIEALRPDVVLLDVQMPGMDGFAVVERVGAARMPPVVFVTGHDEHAVRAFQVHALDFVLKPFDDARLARAMDRVRAQLQLRRDGELGRRLSALLAEVRAPDAAVAAPDRALPAAPGERLTRLVVREDGHIRFVPVRDVDWLEGDGNYVRVHAGGRVHRLRAGVGGLAARLDPARFARIHRSTIVNVERIREVQPWFGGDYVAILDDGTRLRVSRTFAQDLLRPLW